MTIRFYILPIEFVVIDGTTYRGPKYFSWPFDPDPPGIDCRRVMMDYGSINQAILCADILAADHTALVAHADVLAIPINIDSTMTQGAVNQAKTFLENYNIPAGWINAGQTYRSVLRTVTGFFQYFQSVTGLLGHDINLPDGWMNLQYQNIPAAIQAVMLQAAVNNGYDVSQLKPTTTMRAILKFMAAKWENISIPFGLTIL